MLAVILGLGSLPLVIALGMLRGIAVAVPGMWSKFLLHKFFSD